MLAYKRPGSGIKPELADVVAGRILKRDIHADELITWEDLG